MAWIDGGSIRLNGNTHEVVAAYESEMGRGGQSGRAQSRGSATKGRFLRWAVADSQSDQAHVLSELGPVTFHFVIELSEDVGSGEHGIALFDSRRQLMWARAAQRLVLQRGIHVFSHSFPSLPLRPGPYQWQVSLWDSGELIDQWDCEPEMTIATEGLQHHLDEWNGILNLPSQFALETPEEHVVGLDPNF